MSASGLIRPTELRPSLLPLVRRHAASPDPVSTIAAVLLRSDADNIPRAAVRHFLTVTRDVPPHVREIAENLYAWRAVTRRVDRLATLNADARAHVGRAVTHLLRDGLASTHAPLVAYLAVQGAARAASTGVRVMASQPTLAVALGVTDRTVRSTVRALRDLGVISTAAQREGTPLVMRILHARDRAARERAQLPAAQELIDRAVAGEPTLLSAMFDPAVAYGEAVRPRDVHGLLRALGGLEVARTSRERLRAAGIATEDDLLTALPPLAAQVDGDGFTPIDRLETAEAARQQAADQRMAQLEEHRARAGRVWENVKSFMRSSGRPTPETVNTWAIAATVAFAGVPEASAPPLRSALRQVLETGLRNAETAAAIAERIVPKGNASGPTAHNNDKATEEAA
ncbi:hypothetical protein [Microbacterium sp. NPDC055683]